MLETRVDVEVFPQNRRDKDQDRESLILIDCLHVEFGIRNCSARGGTFVVLSACCNTEGWRECLLFIGAVVGVVVTVSRNVEAQALQVPGTVSSAALDSGAGVSISTGSERHHQF